MIRFPELKKYLVDVNSTFESALRVINKNTKGFCLVVDNLVFKGVLTDGDIRRLILKKIDLNTKVIDLIKKKSFFIYEKDIGKYIELKFAYDQVPVLDAKKRIIGLLFKIFTKENKTKDTLVFILAGGLGSRMGKLTKYTPKPMLRINKKPILENIISSFKKDNFVNFVISVNYLSEKISSYFMNGSKFGIKIEYVKEKKFLGTAGSLRLLNYKNSSKNIFIINGDIFSNLNFGNILNAHIKRNNDITICARIHQYKLPFGLISTKSNNLLLNEKPKIQYLINSGIYVIKRDLIKYISPKKYFDMNQFVNLLKKKRKKIGIFSLYENVYDIGTETQYNKIKLDLKKSFFSN